jgi:hypothetical protein
MSTIVIHQPLSPAEHDIAAAKAQNTPCGIEGCNGFQHEAALEAADWEHEVVSERFDSGSVKAGVFLMRGEITADISIESSGEMTAAEFRAMADAYEAFPAWLRSIADRMGELSE